MRLKRKVSKPIEKKEAKPIEAKPVKTSEIAELEKKLRAIEAKMLKGYGTVEIDERKALINKINAMK